MAKVTVEFDDGTTTEQDVAEHVARSIAAEAKMMAMFSDGISIGYADGTTEVLTFDPPSMPVTEEDIEQRINDAVYEASQGEDA